MNKKIITTALAAAFLAVSIPAAAMAYPDFHGRNGCPYISGTPSPAMPQLTDEQKLQIDKLHKEHATAMLPLRDSLSEKRMTLNALSRNPNATPAELRQLAAEITKIKAQMRAAHEELAAKMEKAGVPCPEFRACSKGYGMHSRRGHDGRHWHDCR